MARRPGQQLAAWIDNAMAAAGLAFMDAWLVVERSYRRPLSWLTQRLRFAYYPLLACVLVGWLAWDWNHARTLDAAEDAVFDQIIQWRPFQPTPSGRTVVVEIDDCSIEHFRARGEGGWPWSRQRHADLIDSLDRAGVRAIGLDVLFADASRTDPQGDAVLEAMAKGGGGRFLFASSRLHAAFDARATLPAGRAPGAFRLDARSAGAGPPVALLLPYGPSMATHSGLVNVTRAGDGVLRDVRLYEQAGGWAIPSLPLRLARLAGANGDAAHAGMLRINWRSHSRLPYTSAADIIEGRPVCQAADARPALKDAIVLVGHTAAGINDAKPTPVNMAMPGVEVLAEATEAMVAGTAIRVPPAWLKYVLATILVLLSTFAFWRGEPHEDMDAIFVAVNLVLLAVAFVGLTLFGVFVDIFASIGYGALGFGLCRSYAGVQRARAIGNSDFLLEYDAATHPWLLLARLRFAQAPGLDPLLAKRQRREYRRVLRRFLYANGNVVMIEGVIERKSWLNPILDDQLLLVWKGAGEVETRASARRDLDSLHAALGASGEYRAHDGDVMFCVEVACIDDDDEGDDGRRLRLRGLLGQDLNLCDEWPLEADNLFVLTGPAPDGDEQCATQAEP